MSLTRFRLCAHKLAIETGRYNNIERNDRLCSLCNQGIIESEFHFLFVCTFYTAIRRKHAINSSWPNLNRFITLLSSKCKATQLRLAKFLKEAFYSRQLALEILQ